jgi:hypothetical protein
MATKKKEYINYTAPKGVAKYAHLTTPQTKYRAEGDYSVQVVYDPDDAAFQTFQSFVTAENQKAFAAAKAENRDAVDKTKLFTMDTNKDSDGNKIPTGKTVVKFAHRASGIKKDKSTWTFKPSLFDAAGNPAPKGIVIFGGSVVKVSYGLKHTLMPTGDFYTSLQLQAVQILTLVDAMVRSAGQFGFGKEEGYVADEDAFGEQTTGPGASASEEVPVVVGDF